MELKFKILVLRALMMILYKLVYPATDSKEERSKEIRDLESLATDFHLFMRSLDAVTRSAPIDIPKEIPGESKAQAGIPFPAPEKARPISNIVTRVIKAARPPLRMKDP